MFPFSVKCDYAKGVCVVSGGVVRCKMPADIVSIVSTGLGVAVLAGILSGVCYVLAHGIGKKRSRIKNNEWYCDICGTYLQSVDNLLNNTIVTCGKCGAKVCREKCSKLVQQSRWICENCLKPRESWFQGILKAIQPNARSSFANIMNPNPEHDPDLDSLQKLEKDQVRDFIEKLVNVMLGENVDNASVSRLYNDGQYTDIFSRYHEDLSNTLTELGSALHISISNLPISGQSPCTAHAALKQIIEKLLKEAVNLPLLEKAHAKDHPAIPLEDSNRTYEDLLSTAIINKVISSCQNNLPSSSTNSVSSRLSTSSRLKDEKEYFFGEETLGSKWKATDLDTTSASSVEEWIQSESSFGSRKYVDKVTLMIKQDIEEVEDFDSENDEEDDENFRSSSSLLNDSESNWFLQKRQFQGTHSPVPVPMLVPNPTSEAKVLIGDKPLDDTSDLSDVGSDYEECETPQTTQSLLVQSKHIIGGGQNNFEILENGDGQSESSSDSGIKEVNGKNEKSYGTLDSTKADITVDDDNVEDSSFLSVYSNTEKEAEYTERYASLPRTIIRTSTPQTSYKEFKSGEILDRPEENEKNQQNNEKYSQFSVLGSYSKKEKEKWKHAVEMKNNPYSKENIEKRVKRSSSAVSSLFGSDYYAKQAKAPSGGKLKSSEINGVCWPPPELPKDGPPTVTTYEETDGIHQAIQAIVTPTDEITPPNSFESPKDLIKPERQPQLYKPEHFPVQSNMSEVTSDSDLSFVNFYDVEHSQVFRKTKNEDIQIPIRGVPLGGSYKAMPEENRITGDGKHNQEGVLPNTEEDLKVIVKEVPVAKPRVLTTKEDGIFIKAPVPNQRTIILNRNLSESNLIEDSFDTPPKVLHQKKDNTLISKIYKDPRVRLFALHSRDETPSQEGVVTPVYQHQFSFDSKIALSENSSLYLSKGRSFYSSDDALNSEYESGKTGKMSFFSSEEDLLSLNSETSSRKGDVNNNNGDVKLALKLEKKAISRESHVPPSPHYQSTPKHLSTRKFIYSSSEDLLSIDEIGSLPQRKDNTLISKIYQDPNVRSFAMKSHRDFIPDYEPKRKNLSRYSSDEDVVSEPRNEKKTVQKMSLPNKIDKRNFYSSYDDLSSTEISLENNISENHNEIKYNEKIYSNSLKAKDSEVNGNDAEEGYKSEDIDVKEIAKRHLVRSALGKFSQSDMDMVSAFARSTSMDESNDFRLSVRDLRKKFETDDTKSKQIVSSLTARSLSKQMKESLKQ